MHWTEQVLQKDGARLGVLSAGDFFGELGALLPPSVRDTDSSLAVQQVSCRWRQRGLGQGVALP